MSLPENKTLQEKRQRSSDVAMTHMAFHHVTIFCRCLVKRYQLILQAIQVFFRNEMFSLLLPRLFPRSPEFHSVPQISLQIIPMREAVYRFLIMVFCRSAVAFLIWKKGGMYSERILHFYTSERTLNTIPNSSQIYS